MVRNLVFWPDPILKEHTALVTTFDVLVSELIADLRETCKESNGLGLAAPQIGVPQAVIVALDRAFINPVVEPIGVPVPMLEGCLSFPGAYERVSRYPSITVMYQDVNGDSHTELLTGELAHVVQHETDHILGVTIPDRLHFIARERFLKRLRLSKRRAKNA